MVGFGYANFKRERRSEESAWCRHSVDWRATCYTASKPGDKGAIMSQEKDVIRISKRNLLRAFLVSAIVLLALIAVVGGII